MRFNVSCFFAAIAAAAWLLPGAGAHASPSQDSFWTADPESTELPEAAGKLELEEKKEKGLLLPLGPLFIEKRPDRFNFTLFPLIFHDVRKGDDGRRFTGVFPFYTWSNAKGEKALVVFPLWWNFNLQKRSVWLAPPFYVEKKQDKLYRFFLAPLLFFQRGEKVSFEFIPPVFFRFSGEKTKFLYSLLFYRWAKGDDRNSGIIPLVFWGRNEGKGYGVAFPLFWHFSSAIHGTSKTVLPPFYLTRNLGNWNMGLIPILFASRNDKHLTTTIVPLLHVRKGIEENSLTVITPLVWYSRNKTKNSRGGGLGLFHQYRSEGTNLDAFVPIYFGWNNPNLMQKSTLVFPLLYHSKSPIKRNVSVLGLVWDFHSYHEHRTYGFFPLFIHSKDLWREKYTLWVAPTFQIQKKPEEFKFYLHPIAYFKTGGEKPYDVLFPVWWRFKYPKKERTVFFPFHWDFKNDIIPRRITVFFPVMVRMEKGEETHTGVLLAYHWKGLKEGKKSWKFHLFPLMSFGRTEPSDYYWKFLLGLIGYEKSAGKRSLYMLWLPIGMKGGT
ncbi:MAG: hypothetical protein ABIJ56_01535 [Pseudomonadota bacterium]